MNGYESYLNPTVQKMLEAHHRLEEQSFYEDHNYFSSDEVNDSDYAENLREQESEDRYAEMRRDEESEYVDESESVDKFGEGDNNIFGNNQFIFFLVEHIDDKEKQIFKAKDFNEILHKIN